MGIRFKTKTKKNYLLVQVEGTTDEPDEIVQFIDELLDEPDSRSVDRYLLDYRDFTFGRKEAGTYEVAAKCMYRLAKYRPQKVALLVRPERLRFARLYETIGLTAGVEIKAFDRQEMASIWLAD